MRSRMATQGGAIMADSSFENRLLRMFDEPPALSDADRFARDIEARLDRG